MKCPKAYSKFTFFAFAILFEFLLFFFFFFFLKMKNWSSIWTHVNVDVNSNSLACMHVYVYVYVDIPFEKVVALARGFSAVVILHCVAKLGEFFRAPIDPPNLVCFLWVFCLFSPFPYSRKNRNSKSYMSPSNGAAMHIYDMYSASCESKI
jgi:hypothetical protein